MNLVQLKDPGAVLKYSIDWATNYLASGVTVANSTWAVVPSGSTSDLTLASPLLSTDGGTTTITVSGGVRGKTYRVTNRIVTSSSETDERTVVLRVDDR